MTGKNPELDLVGQGVYPSRMSIDILPGDSFGRFHPMFRRTPAQMSKYLCTLRGQIARESAARRAILTSEFCDGSQETALRLIRQVEEVTDVYLDTRAAAALNLADAIAQDEAVMREVELMERMFSEESNQDREIEIGWGMLHFAMAPYKGLKYRRFVACDQEPPVPMNMGPNFPPAMGGRGQVMRQMPLHTMGGGYVEQTPTNLAQVLAKIV